MIGLPSVFVGIKNSKATGIAAVAGGVGELLVMWGLVSMIVAQGGQSYGCFAVSRASIGAGTSFR